MRVWVDVNQVIKKQIPKTTTEKQLNFELTAADLAAIDGLDGTTPIRGSEDTAGDAEGGVGLDVRNGFDFPVTIYWQGESDPVEVDVVAPGAVSRQQSFPGHRFSVRGGDADKVLEEFVVGDTDTSINLNSEHGEL